MLVRNYRSAKFMFNAAFYEFTNRFIRKQKAVNQ